MVSNLVDNDQNNVERVQNSLTIQYNNPVTVVTTFENYDNKNTNKNQSILSQSGCIFCCKKLLRQCV